MADGAKCLDPVASVVVGFVVADLGRTFHIVVTSLGECFHRVVLDNVMISS